ncbi:MAG: hypothetical protein JWL81_3527 [Verrucomicrobiales bacterium]|nr:hypothetical protein [Verrucomicrobiales bacterium]
MRRAFFILPLLTLAPLPLRADTEVLLQQLTSIGLLPEQKLALRPEEKLDPKRANPFAERAKAKEARAVETVETEEIKIRRIFDTLKISGITKGPSGYSALLGDLILEEGAQVPPVIPNQTQILRVTKVTDKLVQIAWVEGAGYETVAPRKIVKRVELSPKVGVLLAAQPAGTNDPNALTYLDENGKVIWPTKMTPDLEGMMDTLSPTSTADLSSAEEAHLLQAPAQGDLPSGDAENAPSTLEPSHVPGSGPNLLPGSKPAPGEIDPATAIEDTVQPPEPESEGANEDPPSAPRPGSIGN